MCPHLAFNGRKLNTPANSFFNYFLQVRHILTAHEKMLGLGAWAKSCIIRQFRIPRKRILILKKRSAFFVET